MTALGRDPEFLSYFWALASDDAPVRQEAGSELVKYVLKSMKSTDNNDHGIALSNDAEYALTRLVKGLGSSRNSARRGFAAALCELLSHPMFKTMEKARKVLSIADKNSQLTGSVRGAEERDFMFCRLFAVLCLLRSGCCATDGPMTLTMLDWLLQLHQRKGWVRESCTEAVLLLLQQQSEAGHNNESLLNEILSKVLSLFDGVSSLKDMAAWQLMLRIGLQQLADEYPDELGVLLEKHLNERNSALPQFFISDIISVRDTILAATAGFPKVHQVWQYLLSFALGYSFESRTLPSRRISEATAAQENALSLLVQFIEDSFFTETSTHEKRGVGLHVIAQLACRGPPDSLPTVLTKTVCALFKSACRNKSNTLHPMATGLLKQLSDAAAGSSESCVALRSALVLNGGSDFDTVTGSKTLADLLAAMDRNARTAHVKVLIGAIAASATDHASDDDDDDDNCAAKRATSAIDAMCQMVRIPEKFDNKGNVCMMVLTALIRLSCFGMGKFISSQQQSKSNKKKKKRPEGLHLKGVDSADIAECIRLLESSQRYPQVIVSIAGQRLLSLLADYSSLPAALTTIEALNNSTDAGAGGNKNVDASLSLLESAWKVVDFIHAEAATASDRSETIISVSHLYQSIAYSFDDGQQPTPQRKLQSAVIILVLLESFRCILPGAADTSALDSLLEISPAVLNMSNSMHTTGEDDDSDDNEDFLQRLLEVSLDVLSQSQQSSSQQPSAGANNSCSATVYSSKGTRDAVRRMWQAVCAAREGHLTPEIIDGIVAATTGEDINDIISNDTDGEQGSDVADEISDAASQGAADVNKSRASTDNDVEDEKDDDDEEDIMLSEEDALQLLNETDDEDEGAMQHDESMDAALVHMLNLKKQARKQGLMRAQKQELLNRLRAMDLLETIIDRVNSGLLLFPIFLPLLNCARQSYNSTAMQSIAEGTSFTQRLHTLIEQKLCKKKLVLRVEPSDDSGSSQLRDVCSAEDVEEALSPLLAVLVKMLNAPLQQLRQLAHVVFIAVAKIIVGSGASSSISSLVVTLRTMVESFSSRKSSRITSKFIEDIFVQRVPSFCIKEKLWADALVPAVATGASPYLQLEILQIAVAVLKGANGYPGDVQLQLLESVPKLLQALRLLGQNIATNAQIDEAHAGEKGVASSWPVKRLKLLVGRNKDVTDYLRTAVNSDTFTRLTPEEQREFIQELEQYTATLADLSSSVIKQEGSNYEKIAHDITQLRDKLQSIVKTIAERQLQQTETPKSKKRSVRSGYNNLAPKTEVPAAKKQRKKKRDSI